MEVLFKKARTPSTIFNFGQVVNLAID
jgi:hypothetical protein